MLLFSEAKQGRRIIVKYAENWNGNFATRGRCGCGSLQPFSALMMLTSGAASITTPNLWRRLRVRFLAFTSRDRQRWKFRYKVEAEITSRTSFGIKIVKIFSMSCEVEQRLYCSSQIWKPNSSIVKVSGSSGFKTL